MNIFAFDSYPPNFNPAQRKSVMKRQVYTKKAARHFADRGFVWQVEDALTQLVFVAAALGGAALLRYGAPLFPGRDAVSNAIDFGAACGGLHGVICLGKTLLLAGSRRP